MADDRIVALGLLTSSEVRLLGPQFKRLWPVDETPCFEGLIDAIDEADRQLQLSKIAETEPRGSEG